MNYRALALGAALGFAVAIVPSCGGAKTCGPSNCTGCCDSAGKCQASPANNTNTTCGGNGLACADCTKTTQVCSTATHTCVPAGNTGGGAGGGTGGGTGVGGGTGGGSGGGTGGGVATCSSCADGCCSGSVCIKPGSGVGHQDDTACGLNALSCQACASPTHCLNGVCAIPDAGSTDAGSAVGKSCTSAGDCSALGTGAQCHQMASGPGTTGTFTDGYCTRPCTSTGTTACPSDSYCLTLTGFESGPLCWKQCQDKTDCRSTPGYECYDIGRPEGICYADPLPQVDAGPASEKVGDPCTADNTCQPPDDGFCFLPVLPDGGASPFQDGYCSADCQSNEHCAADGGGLCLTFTAGTTQFNACTRVCPTPGATTGCRTGYVCSGYTIGLADGGSQPSSTGICYPGEPADAGP